MTKATRIWPLITILTLVVSMVAACGPTPTEAPPPTEAAPPTEAPPPTEAAPPETEFDLGGREITIAVENAYPPFNVIDEATGEAVGWDFDACRAICEVLNCTPVFVEAAWEGIFEATAAGEYDMVADGVTITAERDESAPPTRRSPSIWSARTASRASTPSTCPSRPSSPGTWTR